MAGIHKYSSSLFIQSGSIAKFKSGITASSLNIEGSVTANKYLLSDGTEVIGGEQKVFFAGAPGDATLGISRSATICIAYLMYKYKIDLKNAFQMVLKARSII